MVKWLDNGEMVRATSLQQRVNKFCQLESSELKSQVSSGYVDVEYGSN